ncbi:MAG: hypothetical protein KBD14_02325 [Candidatus Pacebacteria bacterium]|nr:hypothetical protein [Candidatus Paceibacterota bacterium]
MIDNFLLFFEKIETLESGFVVLVLNRKNVKPILIGLEKNNFSLEVFLTFSKKEASALENLFFDFRTKYSLKQREINVLPEEWQKVIKNFADEEANFKVFKIEDLK